MDFVSADSRPGKGCIEVYPRFWAIPSKDLFIRSGKFYAIWDEANGVWSTSWYRAIQLIDQELDAYAKTLKTDALRVLHLRDASSGSIDKWKHFVEDQMEDNFVPLNSKIIFSNMQTKKSDYASFKLDYPLEEGSFEAYDKLMSVLYSPEEREKLEWGIGCIVAGDNSKIQKFFVLIGDAGTGKSTVLKIIRKMFEGYCGTIDAKAIGNPRASFPLEPLKNNPVIAMQDDADLSKIEDNTRLNSLISHEIMSVNTKYGALYSQKFDCIIFLGSNEEVKITDAVSGLQRRLIDVRPTGITLPNDEYNTLMSQIIFEKGAIAWHCLQVYKANKHKFDKYRPMQAIRSTNPFFNFMEDNYDIMKEGISLKKAYELYSAYCDDMNYQYRMNKLQVKSELMAYYHEFIPDKRVDGTHMRNYYSSIKEEKFGFAPAEVSVEEKDGWLIFDCEKSRLDVEYGDSPAQYANSDGNPYTAWDNVKTTLSQLDTRKLHWLRLPEYVVKVDLDLKDDNGEKSLELNIKRANEFPPTYAEVSKSGCGVHLYYIWKGDEPVDNLSRLIEENVEVKLSIGKMSHRRQLTKCNSLPLRELTTGLPIKRKEEKVIDPNIMETEKTLRSTIERCLQKDVHGDTTSNIDWIYKILEKAYNSDLVYDVSDLHQRVFLFAMNSTNQKDKCVSKVKEMHFKSKTEGEPVEEIVYPDEGIIFYDIEIYPNLFLFCWKKLGEEQVHIWYNPTPQMISKFFGYEEGPTGYETTKKPMIGGFNNRKYDDHICLKRIYGGNNTDLFMASQAIIHNEEGGLLREGYHLSDFDVFDMSSKKQSLKKWENEMHKTHMEMGIAWDQDAPYELWSKIAEYCCNDVRATEAVYIKIKADVDTRRIISKLSGLPMIDTNRQHITKILCGDDKYPDLVYTDLATGEQYLVKRKLVDGKVVSSKTPIGKSTKYKNDFPGYEFDKWGIDTSRYILPPASSNPKSIYLGEDPSEGGYVYSEPGMYDDVWCFDVAGMHPASIIALNKFADRTIIFEQIRDARVLIKHKEFDKVKGMLNGMLDPYLNPEEAKALAGGLKLILNSTYGIGAATFDNPLRDPFDEDNIVAKRGALFMIGLKQKVQSLGYQVVHCKTDSIKVVHPDNYIQNFIFKYGKMYGYDFEIEHKFEKFCLVNKAVYIAKNYEPNADGQIWEATGAQFAHPYVYKTLFTHEPLEFWDMCEMKNVTSSMYLDCHEGLPEGEHNYIFVGRSGLFCPVKPGVGGGELMRESNGKYSSVTGTKDYLWLESEAVKGTGLEAAIDDSYFKNLADKAIEQISKYGDYEWFVS